MSDKKHVLSLQRRSSGSVSEYDIKYVADT